MDVHNHKQQLESYQITIDGQLKIIKDLQEKLDRANGMVKTWYENEIKGIPAKYLKSALVRQVENIALDKYDGHYTVYRFTTHYKGVFGTLMESNISIREQLKDLPSFKTLDELLYWMVEKEPELNAYSDFLSKQPKFHPPT